MAGRGAAIASDSTRRGETEPRKRTPTLAVPSAPVPASAPLNQTPPVSLERTPLTVFSGVGSKTADTLAKLGLLTIADLLADGRPVAAP